MPTPNTLFQPITFDARLCDDKCLAVAPEEFCFQIPMVTNGAEILATPEIGIAVCFQNGVNYDRAYDSIGATCGTPFEDDGVPINAGYPTAGQDTCDAGIYFWLIEFGNVEIDYGMNPITDEVGQLRIAVSPSASPPPPADYEVFTEADANSSIFFKGTESWGAATGMDIFVNALSECDPDDERIKWDVEILDFQGIPSFYEDTFTATDDTFYRLKFSLDKTSAVTVTITTSNGTDIFQMYEEGPDFEAIFNTGTLPVDKTITIRIDFADLTEWPDASYNVDVLTDVSLYEMCKYDIEVFTCAGVSEGMTTQTHYSEGELVGDRYHENIEYCFDFSAVAEGTYEMIAINACDEYDSHTSNCFQVCTTCGETTIKIVADDIKFIGANILDFHNYTGNYQFRVKTDLQDLTQDEERVTYADASYYLQHSYTAFRNVQVLQVWPLQGYARKALAMFMNRTFTLDGVEYRKVDDEAFAPQFQATGASGLRVLVTQVDDFMVSRNA